METFATLAEFAAHRAHHILAVLGAVVVLISAHRLHDDTGTIMRLACLALLFEGLAGAMQSSSTSGVIEVLRSLCGIYAAAAALFFVAYSLLCASQSLAHSRRVELDNAARARALIDIAELQKITSRHAA